MSTKPTQHHARSHGQTDRAALFDKLLDRLGRTPLDTDHPYNARVVDTADLTIALV